MHHSFFKNFNLKNSYCDNPKQIIIKITNWYKINELTRKKDQTGRCIIRQNCPNRIAKVKTVPKVHPILKITDRKSFEWTAQKTSIQKAPNPSRTAPICRGVQVISIKEEKANRNVLGHGQPIIQEERPLNLNQPNLPRIGLLKVVSKIDSHILIRDGEVRETVLIYCGTDQDKEPKGCVWVL